MSTIPCRARLLGITLLSLLSIHCQQPLPGSGSAAGAPVDVSVDTADQAQLTLEPGLTVEAVTAVDVTDAVPPQGAGSATFALDPADIEITGAPQKSATSVQPVNQQMTVSFTVAATSEEDACGQGLLAAEFTVTVDQGVATSVDPPSVKVSDDVRDLLLTGQFDLCTSIQATFSADVTIRGIVIRFSDDDGPDDDDDAGSGGLNDNNNDNDDAGSGGMDDDDDAGSDGRNDNDDAGSGGMDDDDDAGSDGRNDNDDAGSGGMDDDDDADTDGLNDNDDAGSDGANDNDDVGSGGMDDADGDVLATELRAELGGQGGPSGNAVYRLEADRERFKVEVEDFEPGTTHDITINDLVIGQITIGPLGTAEVEFDTNLQLGKTPLPDVFPDVVEAGDTVGVGGLVTGVLQPD